MDTTERVFIVVGAVLVLIAVLLFWTRQRESHPTITIVEIEVDAAVARDASQGSFEIFARKDRARLLGLSTGKVDEPRRTPVKIEDALFGEDKEAAATAKEMNDRIVEHIGEAKEYLDMCLAGLKTRSKADRFEWDSVFDFYGDGTAVTIQDHYSENWPADFGEKEKQCWDAIFVGYSFPSKMQGSLLLSVGGAWGVTR